MNYDYPYKIKKVYDIDIELIKKSYTLKLSELKQFIDDLKFNQTSETRDQLIGKILAISIATSFSHMNDVNFGDEEQDIILGGIMRNWIDYIGIPQAIKSFDNMLDPDMDQTWVLGTETWRRLKEISTYLLETYPEADALHRERWEKIVIDQLPIQLSIKGV